EGLAEAVEVERQRVGANLVAHEEPANLVIRVVAGLGDPAIVGSQETADLGDDADAVRAGDHQPKSAHGKTPETSRGGAILAAAGKNFSISPTRRMCHNLHNGQLSGADMYKIRNNIPTPASQDRRENMSWD